MISVPQHPNLLKLYGCCVDRNKLLLIYKYMENNCLFNALFDVEDDSGERTTDFLHVMKSLSVLGDVLVSLTSKKEAVPYENLMLIIALADSLGWEMFSFFDLEEGSGSL